MPTALGPKLAMPNSEKQFCRAVQFFRYRKRFSDSPVVSDHEFQNLALIYNSHRHHRLLTDNQS